MGRRAVRCDMLRGARINMNECGLRNWRQTSLTLQLASKMAGKKGERAGWRSGAAVIFGVGIWGSPRVRANASHLMPWQAPIQLSRRAGAETALRSRGHAESPDGHTDSHSPRLFRLRNVAGRRQCPSASDVSRLRCLPPGPTADFGTILASTKSGLRRRCPVAVETGTKCPDSRGVDQLGN